MFIKLAFSYNYVNNYSRAMQYIMISFLLLTNFCFSSSNICFSFSIWDSCPRTCYPFKAICMYWLLFRLTAQPSPWNFSLCHLKIFCALLRYWISCFPCFFFFHLQRKGTWEAKTLWFSDLSWLKKDILSVHFINHLSIKI